MVRYYKDWGSEAGVPASDSTLNLRGIKLSQLITELSWLAVIILKLKAYSLVIAVH